MTTAMQTRRALAVLDTAMASANHPARHQLAPGASDDQLTDALAPTGLTVPDELRAVWRWHNGTRPSPDPRDSGGPDQYRRLPGGHTLLSVERSVDLWADLVQLWTVVLERGIWRLHHPGDTVTLPGGRSYPLQVGRPVWLLDDRHPELPPDWPG